MNRRGFLRGLLATPLGALARKLGVVSVSRFVWITRGGYRYIVSENVPGMRVRSISRVRINGIEIRR